MPIVSQLQPKNAREIVHMALGQRLHRAEHAASLRGAPRTGAALPVYRIAKANISDRTLLSRAKKIGWRYPLVGGECPGLVHLVTVRGGFEFGGITEGIFAQRLLDAALLAEHALSKHKKKFQPRLLDIPALHVHALWLRSPRGTNYFIALSESANSMKMEDNIHGMMRRAAERTKLRRLKKPLDEGNAAKKRKPAR
jgi:hypothetical protein